jgi:hypothetical protein
VIAAPVTPATPRRLGESKPVGVIEVVKREGVGSPSSFQKSWKPFCVATTFGPVRYVLGVGLIMVLKETTVPPMMLAAAMESLDSQATAHAPA